MHLNLLSRRNESRLPRPTMVEQIMAAIREHAHTGKKGDGIVLVLPMEEAMNHISVSKALSTFSTLEVESNRY
ncbi:MAG: P-II family nitrogen regulator [Acidobacteria bacterium]|nr:P-II family nitrogen regulator [Acidobacteriota bacterium]